MWSDFVEGNWPVFFFELSIYLIIVGFILKWICIKAPRVDHDQQHDFVTTDAFTIRKLVPEYDLEAVVIDEAKIEEITKNCSDCMVCLDRLDDGKGDKNDNNNDKHSSVKVLWRCGHRFHAGCIEAWLSKHRTCPICRCRYVPRPIEPGGWDT